MNDITIRTVYFSRTIFNILRDSSRTTYCIPTRFGYGRWGHESINICLRVTLSAYIGNSVYVMPDKCIKIF